jgi:uncharacterized protein (TIGR02452 family)
MIKRDGAEIVSARSKNASLAKETIKICQAEQYTSPSGYTVDLSSTLTAAVRGTTLYSPEDIVTVKSALYTPTIEVVNETTAQAAVRLMNEGKEHIVALNFASARNPGGGFLAGAIAQEEDLCRCSGLYSCLKSKPVFYNENILSEGQYYTDNIIYSPEVPFFRNDHNILLEQPFLLSIISAPAPNLRDVENVDEDELIQVLYARALKILKIAAKNGHKNIILGAWGCGAFGNDPTTVSMIFSEVLKDVPAFEHVCFAVYDTREPPVLLQSFKRIVG